MGTKAEFLSPAANGRDFGLGRMSLHYDNQLRLTSKLRICLGAGVPNRRKKCKWCLRFSIFEPDPLSRRGQDLPPAGPFAEKILRAGSGGRSTGGTPVPLSGRT